MSTQKKYIGSSHFKNTAIAIAVASSFAITPAWATPATNPWGRCRNCYRLRKHNQYLRPKTNSYWG